MIRSLGGWSEVRKHGLKGQGHIKSDERILGISLTETAKRFGACVSGVGYSVERGGKIARENDFQLIK